ncbi:pyrroline-5-carboxylate reductase [Marinitoga sp. 38H-ov]|uniref:pyrroline-5-carboxylate reductase n=1 Tax=Marinitoga sp. 38H-ov TaxID=1755814 RepID=UPI0013EB9530|nr:pyrroline-5-carboxylate reductase [Marinitoga sp. 38H-ov]KAF2957017.1 hypothetical protein AS160_03265 [Marinitoga sp. 38H-ov]
MKLGIIGIGNIGSMLLEILQNEEHDFYIIDKNREKIKKYEKKCRVKIGENIEDIYSNSKYIFVTVKPKDMDDVLNEISKIDNDNAVIISTAAGKSLNEILKKSNKKNVIRIMPTIISKIGKGITAITFNNSIKSDVKEEVISMLRPLGEIMEIDEKKFDAFTILNSSGPAFAAYILESYIEGAINIGFNVEDAKEIILKTFEGTIEFIKKENIELSQLKYRVSSPGGVTIKGLYELEQKSVKGAIMKSLYEAYLKNNKF